MPDLRRSRLRSYSIARKNRSKFNSPDTLVAAVSEANNAILVTMDSDFKAIAARTGIGHRRYRKLSLIRFEKCRESQAAKRLASALSLIEHEWRIGNGQRDRRMFVVIGSTVIRTHR